MSAKDLNKIGHAIAYCDMYLNNPTDPGHDSEFDMIAKYKNELTADQVVLIIKEIAEHDDNLPQPELIVRQIESKIFKNYITQRLALSA